MRKTLLIFLSGLLLALAIPSSGAMSQSQTRFNLQSALSRVPVGDWDTIAFTDLTTTMRNLDAEWLPDNRDELNAVQQEGWLGIWHPDIFSLELEAIGFSAYDLERIVAAREPNGFILWLEGQFQIEAIVAGLDGVGYEPLDDFPAEAYQATADDKWKRQIPYISLPDGHTLLIASSETYLQNMLAVYDGQSNAAARDDLLSWMSGLSENITSGVIRFDQAATGCQIDASRLVVHGLHYVPDRATWQYSINIAYPSEFVVSDTRQLADALEFSTYRVNAYEGVVGQHTHLNHQNFYESNSGSMIQFALDLRTDLQMQHLPFEVARQPNTCLLFSTPPAGAAVLALGFVPDLSGGGDDLDLRYGNAEQALYNAGLNKPLVATDSSSDLTTQQDTSLNSTWRTALVYEDEFEMWFGFSPHVIHQTIELTVDSEDYARVIWGDFTTAEVEAALNETGYAAAEQYSGTRIFTLREVPESGGFLLGSLAQTAASPQEGVLVLSNQIVNMHIALDTEQDTFASSIMRLREVVLAARALEDATNVTLRRYVEPKTGGLVCGLPPYKVEGFANVLRPDGWHFLYVVGSNRLWEDAEDIATRLMDVLENSDYPMQGPGSETFGEVSTVFEARTTQENDATVIVVDLQVSGTEQQASFFGQDLAQTALSPCALGDATP